MSPLLIVAVSIAVSACGRFVQQDPNDAPWKSGASAVVETASAVGPLGAACPTLAQAKGAAPAVVNGPDINTTVYKNMVLQCGFGFGELNAEGGSARISVLVFDASAEGKTMWDSVRTDPSFPSVTDVAGLGDVGFTTGGAGHNDVWVVTGKYGIHMYHDRIGPVSLDQMVALARLVVAGLVRAG
jgi:hypothetical protein